MTAHRIERDLAGFFQNWPRLTCRRPECREATLVRQPYMSDEQWRHAREQFLDAHPEEAP